MDIISIMWILLFPAIILVSIIGGILLIVKGVKRKKAFISILGFLSCITAPMPYISFLFIHIESFFTFDLYFGLLSVTGFSAYVNGSRNQVSSIRNIGAVICSTALLGVFIF
ncbi:hypothetical protein [Bacillus manliponensis]|uniref:hypothetical protein n=1 Tax=Bacillus manliponensis TaxID=574376 RepID=UPI0035160CED